MPSDSGVRTVISRPASPKDAEGPSTSEADDALVLSAVEDLTADHERIGRPLELERVERLVHKRKLSFAQMATILDRLAESGVPIEIKAEESDESSDAGLAPSEVASYVFTSDARRQARRLLEHALLDAETEKALARAIAIGLKAEVDLCTGEDKHRTETVRRGQAARERLTTSNLRLVWQIADRYARISSLDVTDLFQEGVIGLLRAVDKFDPDEGTRFSTYAVWWIRQAVTRAIADRGRTIRFPVHIHDALLRLKRAARLLERELGRSPSRRELAQELAWDLDKVAFLEGLYELEPISLDAPSHDDEGAPLVELVGGADPGPEARLARQEEDVLTREAIAELPPRLRNVMTLRIGVGGGDPETLERIGQSYALTRERIRQIEKQAMKRLRRTLPDKLGLPPAPDPEKASKVESEDDGEKSDE